MTRGRRKDLTIPPSRALLQQRDYRARKAQYVSDLESRCRRAEEENVHLRKELETLQARLDAPGPPAPPAFTQSPQFAAASSDLMHHLTVTAASLARFQQIALNPCTPNTASGHLGGHPPITLATPTYTPSPVPAPHARLASPRIELPPLNLPAEHNHTRPDRERPAYPHRSLPSRVMGSAPTTYQESSECCDGYVDCRGLIEEEDDEMDEDESDRGHERPQSRFAQRMSDVRSTASSSGPEDHGHMSRTTR